MIETQETLYWLDKQIVALLRARGRTMKGLHDLLAKAEIVLSLESLKSAVGELQSAGLVEFQTVTDSWYLTDKGRQAVEKKRLEAVTRLSVYRKRERLSEG